MIPDSPTRTSRSPRQNHRSEGLDVDDTKSESPELENIYDVPHSNAGTPVDQSSQTVIDAHTFVKPALPVPKKQTNRHDQSSPSLKSFRSPLQSTRTAREPGALKEPGVASHLVSSSGILERRISDTPRDSRDIWEIVSTDAESSQEPNGLHSFSKRRPKAIRSTRQSPAALSNAQVEDHSTGRSTASEPEDRINTSAPRISQQLGRETPLQYDQRLDRNSLLATAQFRNSHPIENGRGQKSSSPDTSKDHAQADDALKNKRAKLVKSVQPLPPQRIDPTVNGKRQDFGLDQPSNQLRDPQVGDSQARSEPGHSIDKLTDEARLPLAKDFSEVVQVVIETTARGNANEQLNRVKRKQEPSETSKVIQDGEPQQREKKTTYMKARQSRDKQEAEEEKANLAKQARVKKEGDRRRLEEENLRHKENAEEEQCRDEKAAAKGQTMKEKQSSKKLPDKEQDTVREKGVKRTGDRTTKEVPDEPSMSKEPAHQNKGRGHVKASEAIGKEEIEEQLVKHPNQTQTNAMSLEVKPKGRLQKPSKVKEQGTDEPSSTRTTITPKNQQKRQRQAKESDKVKNERANAAIARAKNASQLSSSNPTTPSRTLKSSTPMIPGREIRKPSALSNGSSSQATPSVSSNLETQIPLPSAMRKPHATPHRSVSFADDTAKSTNHSAKLLNGRHQSQVSTQPLQEKKGNYTQLQQSQLGFVTASKKKPSPAKRSADSRKQGAREEIIISSGEDSTVSSHYSEEDGESKEDNKRASSLESSAMARLSSVEQMKEDQRVPQQFSPQSSSEPSSEQSYQTIDIKVNETSVLSSQSADMGAVDGNASSKSSSRSPARFTSRTASTSSPPISRSISQSDPESNIESDSGSESDVSSSSENAEPAPPSQSEHSGLKQSPKRSDEVGPHQSSRRMSSNRGLSQTSEMSPGLSEKSSEGSEKSNPHSSDPAHEQLQRDFRQSTEQLLDIAKPLETPTRRASSARSGPASSSLAAFGKKGLKAAGSLFPSLTDFKTNPTKYDPTMSGGRTSSIAPRGAGISEALDLSSSEDDDDSSETTNDDSSKDANRLVNGASVNTISQRGKKTTGKAAKGILNIIKGTTLADLACGRLVTDEL